MAPPSRRANLFAIVAVRLKQPVAAREWALFRSFVGRRACASAVIVAKRTPLPASKDAPAGV